MTIEMAAVSSPLLAEYAAIPIVFEVTAVLSARQDVDGSFVLTERSVEQSYIKDYDAVGDPPIVWPSRFDTSMWALFLARDKDRRLGGATVALPTPGLDVCEGRDDLAVLWDIRVAPTAQGRGVGRTLFMAAEAWAFGRGCGELKAETQNINVPACRFYAAVGCQLRVVREDAYPEYPGEVQFLWYKAIQEPSLG